MHYAGELELLREVFSKSQLQTRILAPEELLLPFAAAANRTPEAAQPFSERTVYHWSDRMNRNYLYLLLPEMPSPRLLLVGPYQTAPAPQDMMWLRTQGLQNPARLEDHLPVLEENSSLLLLFGTFCERIWENSFDYVDVSTASAADLPVTIQIQEEDLSETIANMEMLEKRYAYENELIRAVTNGHLHMERRLRQDFSLDKLEQRGDNALRSAKNYCIIMNTLLRKAAESGGVHPLYLHRASSAFSLEIEKLAAVTDANALIFTMFRGYCRLVWKHSVQKYSLTVRKTILMIEADLSADLAPALLAASQGVSAGYLSTVFKKETGQTITEYIRAKRMEYAGYLLTSTTQQVQTIALYCGVPDVQYFSKMFKKVHGCTPTEFRAQRRQS